ncbi:TPA: type A2 lantipeptide [Streptococcus equi subsp. zooepidemicus]|nr:type A2 lantipeptide [Streptococcus equi subsp. zooepidemicus]
MSYEFMAVFIHIGGAGHGVNTISAECRWNSLQAIFTCC